ncbi:MAG: formate dehydrogenase accessory sulfurtransferase FdhD [Aquabacterium sp.]|uniref:formate dehydrogenase accessory sulfurtransferase FdhD n=1 Tax=Aquabacterium sp. TaxID=1872578 RepID=UPI00271989C4|nr:formate dehydrogenase accessory sulfurtransferase FdhD [Aquabacterium sp.]MDO9005397.1 formate dehydrogenase accessory sulfurtransferase FdhD [Aquabacterium sp.]
MSESGWSARPVLRSSPDGAAKPGEEAVAVEAPVALLFNGVSHVVMMATPLNLAELGLGFALSEGLLDDAAQCYGIDVVSTPLGWEVRLEVATRSFARLQERRRQMSGRTGCGVCGIESLQQWAQAPARPRGWSLPDWLRTWRADDAPAQSAVQTALLDLPGRQVLNARTGALHAAAWVTPQGQLLHVFEDVGRHNALDKLLGHLAQSGVPMSKGWVLMTSRASHELVHKCIRAGVPLLATVSAPTSLAIDAAQAGQLRLWAWCRDGRFSTYA